VCNIVVVVLLIATSDCNNEFLSLSLRNTQSWDAFFKSASAGMDPGQAYQSPPMPGQAYVPTTAHHQVQQIDDHLSVQAIIRSYQVSTE
jgi:hypothetical protein